MHEMTESQKRQKSEVPKYSSGEEELREILTLKRHQNLPRAKLANDDKTSSKTLVRNK